MALNEKDLPELLADDLDGHFKQLVSTYQHRLYGFALRQTGRPEDAEDIVQEAFIRAYYALTDYSQERIHMLRLQPWLYKITLNVLHVRMRKSGLQSVPLDMSEDSTALEVEGDWRDQPEVIVADSEFLHELESLVLTLPERYRTVVNLYYFEGHSYREIAELLAQPIGTVKSQLYRGTQLLRLAMRIREDEVS